MEDKYFVNELHRLLVSKLLEAGIKPAYPLMLTATQADKSYTLSSNFTGTDIKIPRNDVSAEDVQEINNSDKYRVILNNVWEAKL